MFVCDFGNDLRGRELSYERKLWIGGQIVNGKILFHFASFKWKIPKYILSKYVILYRKEKEKSRSPSIIAELTKCGVINKVRMIIQKLKLKNVGEKIKRNK